MTDQVSSHSPWFDANLITRARAGGPEAAAAESAAVTLFEPLIARHLNSVRPLTRADREDAEQDARIVALRLVRAAPLDGQWPFEKLCSRRVRDAVLDQFRDRRTFGDRTTGLDAVGDRPDQAATDALDQVEIGLAVRAFVATLPPAQRAVVHAVYWDGQSAAEVARRRGVSRAAVSQILNRVYAAGRRALANSGPSDALTEVAA